MSASLAVLTAPGKAALARRERPGRDQDRVARFCEHVVAPGTKTDAVSHGNDHFFPGPTDIAWDLAGVIVEWQLDSISRTAFLDRYRRQSADDPSGRLCAYELTYALARLGFSRVTAHAMARSPEEPRLLADCARYRQVVERWLWMRCRSGLR